MFVSIYGITETPRRLEYPSEFVETPLNEDKIVRQGDSLYLHQPLERELTQIHKLVSINGDEYKESYIAMTPELKRQLECNVYGEGYRNELSTLQNLYNSCMDREGEYLGRIHNLICTVEELKLDVSTLKLLPLYKRLWKAFKKEY